MLTLPEYLMLIFSLLTIICMRKILAVDPPPIFRIYSQPGNFYWCKVLFMYIVLKLKSLKTVTLNYDEIDKPQGLSDSDKPIDAVYFNCANSKNDALIVGVARRKTPLIDGFLKLRLKYYGVLTSPKVPETSLEQKSTETGYNAEGISIKQLVPKTKWEIKYNGMMQDAKGNLLEVQLDVKWHSNKECFNFDHDMDAYLMATAIAKERWSPEYFRSLQLIHQTHYEQPGELLGTAIVNGEKHEIQLTGLRDHSYGHHRDWRYFHRYMMHLVTLENGDQMNISALSLPLAFSSIQVGYYYNAANNKLFALQGCDLQLYQHGENGNPPKNYAFRFRAGNKHYLMEVEGIESSHFLISKDCEAKIIEMYSNFKVNGIKGWGAVEWQYRNVHGRAALE